MSDLKPVSEELLLHYLAMAAAKADGTKEEDLEFASVKAYYVGEAKRFRAMWNELWLRDPPVGYESGWK